MSITDELRKAADDIASTAVPCGASPDYIGVRRKIDAIADRIDAEHQKALDEWKAEHGQMWLKGYVECHAELLEGNETLASDLESCGWVRLPKDADGEYIRIGDVMEWVRYEDDDPTIVRKVLAVGADVFFAWSDEHGRYAQYEAHAYRHHHAPTVEDVLREFALACEGAGNAGPEVERIATEYASKLQLREDA